MNRQTDRRMGDSIQYVLHICCRTAKTDENILFAKLKVPEKCTFLDVKNNQ